MKDKIYEQREVEWTTNSTEQRPIKDFIVESVIDQFKDRSNVGIKKYGVTLDREDLRGVRLICGSLFMRIAQHLM